MAEASRRAGISVFFLTAVGPIPDSTIDAEDRAAITYAYGEFIVGSTEGDRRAALGIWPWTLVLPPADSTIDAEDRARVSFAYYAGAGASEPADHFYLFVH